MVNSNNFRKISLSKLSSGADESVIDCLNVVNVKGLAAPESDELQVKFILSAVHPCDLLCCAGIVSRSRQLGAQANTQFLPGIEAVAEIVSVGTKLIGDFKTGQRVVVKAWPLWGEWEEADGVWSEYLNVHHSKVLAVPEGIDDATASVFVSISVTPYVMLIKELGLKTGDWIIQAAAGSELGKWVIKFAESAGINVINLVRRAEQVQELKDMTGASYVFHCPSDGSHSERLIEKITDLTRGKNVAGGLDPISDGMVASIMLRVLSRYGKILKFGALGNSEMTLTPEALTKMSQEGLTIKGFSIQNWWIPDTDDKEKRETFNAVWNYLLAHKISVDDSLKFSFNEIGSAIATSLKTKSSKVFLKP